MKKIIKMAAGALPLMLVACTNELENVAVENTQQAPQEIVGANLVSKGLTINVNRGDGVDSRIDGNGNFEQGDKVGLAWYKSNQTNTIYGVQLDPLTHDWTEYLATPPSDNKIFGNHKFTKTEGDFQTDANVYEGFHYAYFPYAYEKQVGKKIVTPNAKAQVGTADDELWNEAFYISSQDTLLATSANEDGTISKRFDLVRLVWGLKFNLTPAQDILGMQYLKDFQIRQVQIQTGGDAWTAQFFNPAAQIIPGNLPYALYDDKTGAYMPEETKEQLYNMALYGNYTSENDNKLAVAFTEAAGMMTTVVENPSIKLNAKNTVRMMLFPTDAYNQEIKPEELAVEVLVDCGKFRFYTTTSEKNLEALKKLREFLSTGYNGYKASVLANQNIGFDFTLTGADFIPDFSSITNITEWENAVKLVKDLKLENPEFTVDGNVEFTESIPMPEDGVVVNTSEAGQLNIVGDVTLPEDLLMDENDKLVVSENATLTVEDNVQLTANVINNGVIKAGKKSLISKVTNNSRIEVVYGSYVEVEEGKEGIIAYEVLAENKETPARINTLINGGNNGKYACVNTLVINKGITFNLMMSTTSTSEEDPYYNNVTVTNDLVDLKDINIEMNGGTIKGEQEVTKSVSNIEVKAGTNTIKDINIVGELKVNEGAKVTVDATAHNHGVVTVKHNVSVGEEIINKGTVTANVNINTKNIDNEEGKTVVEDGYTIWYTNAYIQGGIADGNILKKGTPSVEEGTEIVVVNNIEELKNALTNQKAYIAFGSNIQGDVTVEQIQDYDVVIDGNDFNYTGTMYLDGNSRNTGAETLKIKNINFTKVNDSEDVFDFISANTTSGDTRYAHNVTVENCRFTASGSGEVVGMRYRQCYNMVIKNCEAAGLHSLLWSSGCTSTIVDGVNISDCKNGVDLGNVNGQEIKNSYIKTIGEFGYAVRVKGNGSLKVEDCNFEAKAPILIRENINDTVYDLNMSGSNTLVSTGSYQIIATAGNFEEGQALTKAAGIVNISGAGNMKIFK